MVANPVPEYYWNHLSEQVKGTRVAVYLAREV